MPGASLTGIEFVIKGNADSASNSVKKLTDRMKELNSTFKSSSGISKISGAFKVMQKDISSAIAPMKKLGAAFKRIIFYRAIRFAIKQVTEAFQVGLQNAYQFSKAVGYDLAGSLDNIATKSLTMKNQMGAAFGGLIQAIEPIVLRLIALVTRAANAIAQLMAILGGKATYLKAVDTMTEWGEAVGGAGAAAKEALKYLAPFDELNVLPDDKNGGGGGGGGVPDYSAMFEETAVSQALQDFISDFKITVSDVLFDWSDLTGEQIAEKALAGLFALTGAGVGFILGGVPGAIVGSLIGLSLGLVADTLVFDHDGVLSKEEIGHSLQYVLNALAGGVVGFVVGGPGGALIGASIGLGLSLLADIFDTKAAGENKNTNWLNQLTTALTTLAGGVIGFVVGGPAGALIGATIGLGISAVIESIKFNNASETGTGGLDYFITEVLGLPTNEEWKQYGRNIWNWIVEGFQDFFGELKHIFVDPIVNAFEDFSFSDIIGGNDSSGEGGGWLSQVFGGSLDIEAVVTSVKDNVPAAQKIIDGVKGGISTIAEVTGGIKDKVINGVKAIFGSTDKGASLSSANKTIDAKAKFTSMVKAFTSGATVSGGDVPLINSKANFMYIGKAFSSSTSTSSGTIPVIASKANFQYMGKNFASNASTSSGTIPLFPSKANFLYMDKNFASNASTSGGSIPLFPSKANFLYRAIDGLNTVFSSKAKFTSRDVSELNRTINTSANFTNGWWHDPYNNPTLSVNGKITSVYKDPYLATPTIDVTARITGSTGNYTMASGGILKHGVMEKIPQYASGTTRAHGSLFIAGESGAEVVGHIGGRTEVLNRSQLAATMYASVRSAMSGISFNLASPGMGASATDDGANEDMLYRAFLRALNDSDNDVEVNLDGNTIYKSVVKHNRMERQRTGMNPMLSY